MGTDLTRDSDLTPLPSPTLTVTYEIANHSYSGIRVAGLKVLGEVGGGKLFKGIRTGVRGGEVEVRW